MGFPYEMHRYGFDGFNVWSRTKDGNFDGFSSSIEVVPELNFGVVILNNNDGMDAHNLTQPLVQFLAPFIRNAIIQAKQKPLIPKNPSMFLGAYENKTEGLTFNCSSFDRSSGTFTVPNFNGGANGYLEFVGSSGNEWNFFFRVNQQVEPKDTWSVERGCMLWLFNNADGAQVVYKQNSLQKMTVYLVGQAGYNIGLNQV